MSGTDERARPGMGARAAARVLCKRSVEDASRTATLHGVTDCAWIQGLGFDDRAEESTRRLGSLTLKHGRVKCSPARP